MYALLEKAHMAKEAGLPPTLPLWLAPTQLRIIPVAERHLGYIEELLPALTGIRVDVDDRDETVSKKIRDAGREWIPYVAVVGDQEVERHTLRVTIREGSGKNRQTGEELSAADLQERIATGIKGKPFRSLPLALRLSERAKFVG